MTTIETPPPAAPEPAQPPRRSGFYVTPWVFAVLGGLALLVAGFVVGRAVDRRNHGDRPFFRGADGGAGHPALRLLILLVVIALVVAAVVALVRHFSHRDGAVATAVSPAPAPATPGSIAEQVLADRFARGEIDEAEFVSRRDTLRR
jgi:putative membrane protein